MTICTHDHRCIFGDVEKGVMVLNDVGKMVDKWWQKISDKYNTIEIDEYCIMPNHLHGIITIVGADPCVRPNDVGYGENDNNELNGKGRTLGSAPTIGFVIQWFKTMSTNEYIRNVKNGDWPVFNKRLWQRNFYEHVIRNEPDANRVREYIMNNPAEWEMDEYYEK